MKKIFVLSSVVSSLLLATGINRNLQRVVPDTNTVLVNQEYVDSLPKGWNLIGVEHNITDLSVFKNVDITWINDRNTKNWEVYSNMPDINGNIESSPYKQIKSIPAASGIWIYRKIDLPKFTYFAYDVLEKNDKEAKVELKVNIALPQNNALFYEAKVYDNEKEVNVGFLPQFDDNNYSTADMNLTGGFHKITVCQGVGSADFSPATIRYNVCKSLDISVDLPLSSDKYTNKFELGFPSNALGSDDNYMYVIDRNNYYIYKINPSTNEKEKLFKVSSYPNSLEIYDNYFYVGQVGNNKITKYDANGSEVGSYNVSFPDGLTILDKKIYSVAHDRDGKLLVMDLDFNQIGTFDTGLDDICGLAHDDKYLYILTESGDVYRIDPQTDEKIKIFNNQSFFRDNNTHYGIEGITVYNSYLWISYIDDESLYKIDVPLN